MTTENKTADWFDELNEEQQKEIKEGLAQADRGETLSHEQVVALFDKWGLR